MSRDTVVMDLQHIRCFLAVAEELHFGRAAERLHLTPSPVSRTVKELERQLHVDLFVRTYHTVELTSAGQALMEPAREILKNFDTFRQTARSAASNAPRMLHVGGTHLAPPSVLD